jgi:hypothetical protein
VPINSLLQGRAFDAEVVAMMGEVFEDVAKTLGLIHRKDPVTELIAHRVVELVQSGEGDPVRLKQLTLESIHGPGPKVSSPTRCKPFP